MCWAYRNADVAVDANNGDLAGAQTGRVTRAGQQSAILVKGPRGLEWRETRYGMSFIKPGGSRQLIWNARDDKLDTVETWSRLIQQRFILPVDAFVENIPDETWFTGEVAWLVGFYDVGADGGSVTITEAQRGGRRPILLTREGAMTWLGAEQWDAVPGLANATRIMFDEADLFRGKALATDARNPATARRAA